MSETGDFVQLQVGSVTIHDDKCQTFMYLFVFLIRSNGEKPGIQKQTCTKNLFVIIEHSNTIDCTGTFVWSVLSQMKYLSEE